MSETPTSGLAVLVADLKNIVANSSTFQALGGFAGVEEAAANVFIGNLRGDEESLPRPYALCFLGNENKSMSTATGGAALTFTGQMVGHIALEALIPEELTSLQDAYVWFCNQVGALMLDIETAPLTQHAQHIRGVSLDGGPSISESPAVPFMRAMIGVHVGFAR